MTEINKVVKLQALDIQVDDEQYRTFNDYCSVVEKMKGKKYIQTFPKEVHEAVVKALSCAKEKGIDLNV